MLSKSDITVLMRSGGRTIYYIPQTNPPPKLKVFKAAAFSQEKKEVKFNDKSVLREPARMDSV